MGGKSVSRGRAFRQHIPVLAKRSRPPVDSRCAACRPRLTAAQGPRVEQRAIVARTLQKCQVNNQSNSGATLRLRLWLWLFWLWLWLWLLLPGFITECGPGGPAALPGAPLKRRAGGGKPAGWFAWMRTSLASVHGWTVDKPRNPAADLAGRDARKARKRGVVFSWVLLFWTSKREVPRPPQEGESSAFQDDQSGRTGPRHARAIPLQDLIATRVRQP